MSSNNINQLDGMSSNEVECLKEEKMVFVEAKTKASVVVEKNPWLKPYYTKWVGNSGVKFETFDLDTLQYRLLGLMHGDSETGVTKIGFHDRDGVPLLRSGILHRVLRLTLEDIITRQVSRLGNTKYVVIYYDWYGSCMTDKIAIYQIPAPHSIVSFINHLREKENLKAEA